MKIGLRSNPEKIYTVYGVYWAVNQGRRQQHYRVIEPDDAVGGFSVLLEEDVQIKDPSLDHYVVCEADHVEDIFVHIAAYPYDEFYYDLIDCGEYEKVEIVFENMRKLGLEP